MAWTERRGKKWLGRYLDENEQKRSVVRDTKREARIAAEEQEARIRKGVWVDPNAGKLTFGDYFENHWLPNRVYETNTVAGYMSHYRNELRPYFGDKPLSAITTGVIQRWVIDMGRRGASANTISARYKALQTILAGKKGVSAVRDKLIEGNPCAGIDLPVVDKRQVTIYSYEETEAVIEALDPWWRPLPLLATETGMRWGELLGLKVESFDMPGYHTVTVMDTVIEVSKELTGNGTRFAWKPRPKSRLPRRIRLSQEASTLVEQLVRERRLFGRDRLFSMQQGEDGLPLRTPEWPEGLPPSRAFFRQSIWVPAHEETGIKRRRFHDLRASHISWLLGANLDIATVMEQAGHTQIATTQLYTAAMADASDRAVSALDVIKQRARKNA